MIKGEYKFSEQTASIIGAAMEVHSILGCGFQEVIYQRALEIEFNLRRIPSEREFEMPISYKNYSIGTRRVDFLVTGNISVELKAVTKLEPFHLAQAINYLEAYNLEVGLLLNFGSTSLVFNRVRNNIFNPKIEFRNNWNHVHQLNQTNQGSDNVQR